MLDVFFFLAHDSSNFVPIPSTSPGSSGAKLVHEQLALQWSISSGQPREMALNSGWFFLELMVKAMIEHLATTSRLGVNRKIRFSEQFHDDIINLVASLTSDIVCRQKTSPEVLKSVEIIISNIYPSVPLPKIMNLFIKKILKIEKFAIISRDHNFQTFFHFYPSVSTVINYKTYDENFKNNDCCRTDCPSRRSIIFFLVKYYFVSCRWSNP